MQTDHMIERIHIENFKLFQSFTLSLNSDLNIIVGDNESGKSTLLEAINLALTKRLNGKLIEYEMSSYLFNKLCVDSFLKALKAGKRPALPTILIELYLGERSELQFLRGTNNSAKTDSIGVKLEIAFDEDYKAELTKLFENPFQVNLIPIEYYRAYWLSFANNALTNRGLPIGVSHIDATAIRLQSGADYYLQNIIGSNLDLKDRVALSVAYRKLKEDFANEPAIKQINADLTQRKGAISDKTLAISIDVSQKANWDTNLVPHLDDIPFQLSGKGEQSALKIMLALERNLNESHIILIEEPENHLSFSSMNKLIAKITDRCTGKQIIIATHSAYVLNKLGMTKVILIAGDNQMTLKALPQETQEYFKKLSGYDTLRLILARKAILVEGPSDELIVQKAFLVRHRQLPIQVGVDVINVRGLSFKRFLDIAKEIRKHVVVVTDNDGDYARNVAAKYAPYSGVPTIHIAADANNALMTLEPHIAACNSLDVLNRVFGTRHNASSLLEYMKKNKTECALRIFDTTESVVFPEYVNRALE
jgi:AAA15 family ATPase/GTPase